MKRKMAVLVLSLCSLLWLIEAAIAEEVTNPILKKLVEKGILTQEEAISILEEMEKETVEKEKQVEEKIEKKVAEAVPAEDKDLGKLAKALRGFKFEGLWYISYQNGETSGDGYNKFALKRGYLTVKKEILPWLKGRITLDITTAPEETGKLAGSVVTRLKYLYAQAELPDFAFFTKPFIEVGMVHMPWLDFEQRINHYRCQDTMFIERNKVFIGSADLGLTFVTLFGEMGEEYQRRVSRYYPGRYGSMAVGIYNGGSHKAAEKNENKVLEGRLTIRPLPDIIPGLQFSYFGTTGKGNKETSPDWKVNLGFVSYEHEYFALTGQYYWGRGNQKGADENNKDGYSFFAELKPHKKFGIIGRYDYFDPNDKVKSDENERYIAGIAYHLDKQHKNMILLDYDIVKYKEVGRSDDKRVQATLQIKF
jgi:polyhydroxyalkanoate synthesis regulator phasin